MESSLVAQGRGGVDAGGAPGGQVAGGEGGDEERGEGGAGDDGVVRLETVQEGFDQAGAEEGGDEADGKAGRGEGEDLTQNHPYNCGALRAEGHPDADLAGAAGDRVGHRTVEPDAGDNEGQDGEAGTEVGERALLRDGLLHAVGLGGDLDDGG